MKRVLLVEDDPRMAELYRKMLEDEGFESVSALTLEALQRTLESPDRFDLVLLDRMIAAADTRDFLPRIRNRWGAPVLVVSAINTPGERADLLDLGADDYLGKPFLGEELLARVRSLLRRSGEQTGPRVLGRARFDLSSRRLTVGSVSEELPAREFFVLKVLSDKPGRVLSRKDILALAWGNASHSETNLVEATITNLRRRLEGLDTGLAIKNQRHAGYWLEV